jgi:hypothetical protein
MMPASERRAAVRERTLLSGILIHGLESATVECAVRNLGRNGGALVRLTTALPLTPPIILLIARLDAAYLAEVVWRRNLELGVRFLGACDLTAPQPPAESTARRLLIERRAR